MEVEEDALSAFIFPLSLDPLNPDDSPPPEWADGALYFQSEAELFGEDPPEDKKKELKRIESDDDFIAHFSSLLKSSVLKEEEKPCISEEQQRLREMEWFSIETFADEKKDAVK